MELRHLRYFVAVAEEMHFGRAAKKLHIAQPPLSQQIMSLEHELGVKLIDRSRRRIRLTDAGSYFLKEAHHLLHHLDRVVESARRIDRGQAGRLVIGFVGSVVHNFLPDGLRAFRKQFPDVELVLQEMNTAEQARLLHAHRLDIGFLYPDAHDTLIATQTLIRAPLMAVLPEKHPLASRKSVNMKELAREHFIANTRSSEPVVRDAFVSLCHAAGFSPVITQEAGQVQTVLGLVASGLGVCLLPDFIKNIKRPGVRYIPLAGSPLRVELALAWRADNASTLVRSFVNVITSTVHP